MRKSLLEKIDAIVTNRWLALPVFFLLLWFIFWVTFALGQYPMDWIDAAVRWFGAWVGSLLADGWARDLLVDGIIAGVGSVLVFLPNIIILYFFISLMEFSGYMARAAVIMDGLMRHIGLRGQSFIPMVMGFGCNVPAVMATREIGSHKSRLVTLAIIPFISCAGRLPIFVLFAGAFFPEHPTLALLGIYLLGIVVAILSSLLLGRFIKDSEPARAMGVPPLKMPSARAVAKHTWASIREFLGNIATIILVFSIAIWFLGYFPRHEGASQAYQQEHSCIGVIGKAVEPAMDPLGFNWKMDVGLLTGIGAKELVISSLGVMYAQEETEGAGLQDALKSSIPTAAALAYMVFVLLYIPCIATFAAIKKETGSWWWAILLCLYTILVAWLCAFAAFRIGLLLWP